MLEKADELIAGIRIIKKILGVKEVYLGIEDNKYDAIEKLSEKCNSQNIKVVELHTKYPQGGEKTLIYAITKREVPAGGLPMDIGAVVNNIGTCIAVYEAVAKSKPLYERVVTVTGRVKEPKNLLVRNGTLMMDLIEQAGGYDGEPVKLINGGPMMGFAMPSDDLPVIKGTSGLIVFNKEDVDSKRETIECIRCGKCVENCPMNLHPSLISKYAEKNRIDDAEKLYAMDCFECGCCAYNCPSHIPLVHFIRYAKSEIVKKRAKNKEKEAQNKEKDKK
jgi:electron transport complex protein RnfC